MSNFGHYLMIPFSKFQSNPRESQSEQLCLLMMLGLWKVAVGKNKALTANLSKNSDCLSLVLFIPKLHMRMVSN